MEDRNTDIPNIENAFVDAPRRYRSEARSMSRLGRLFDAQPRNYAPARTNDNSQTVIYEPRTYDDVQKLIDHLKVGEQVIVNFAKVDKVSLYRMLDFMSGAVYALNGTIQKITADIFLFAPYGAKISMPEG